MNFTDLNLSDKMQENLAAIGYAQATPIQLKAIPVALEGRDVIGQAQTGTGKTASFSIPLIEQMQANKTVQTLILVPTRELAIQVAEAFKVLSKHTDLRVATVFGGASIERQIRDLKSGFECVVATPGRCIDLMRRNILRGENIQYLVLDEVDEMLNMGFIDDVETIVSQLNPERQTLFFSATMTDKIEQIAKRFLTNPERIQIKATTQVLSQIEQKYVELRDNQKLPTLIDMIYVGNPERVIIFARTKRRVDEITDALLQEGFHADRIHGDLSQEQRTFAFKKFRAGQTRMLVATDVAARGLDIQGVSHVYNYDLPQEIEYYVHRIGRTGRAGATGEAIAFITPKEYNTMLPLIERKTKSKVAKTTRPTIEEVLKAVELQAAKRLTDTIAEGKLEDYEAVAAELLEGNEAQTLLAAALRLLTPEFDKAEFIEKRKQSNQRDSRGGGDRGRGGDRGGRGGFRGGDRGGRGGDRGGYRGGNDRGGYRGNDNRGGERREGDRAGRGHGHGERREGGFRGGNDRGGYRGNDNRGGYRGNDRGGDRGGYRGGDRREGGDRGSRRFGDRD
ncbi:MAG: DEAD/DEAH box helicase [Culicoidibacterales bacterium]